MDCEAEHTTVGSKHLGDGKISKDDVLDGFDSEANTNELCEIIISMWFENRRPNILDPLAPIMDLLAPTLTVPAPEIVPDIITIPAVSPDAADLRAARVVTVVTFPPFPPVVPPFCVA